MLTCGALSPAIPQSAAAAKRLEAERHMAFALNVYSDVVGRPSSGNESRPRLSHRFYSSESHPAISSNVIYLTNASSVSSAARQS